jgi:hypothetical protein
MIRTRLAGLLQRWTTLLLLALPVVVFALDAAPCGHGCSIH